MIVRLFVLLFGLMGLFTCTACDDGDTAVDGDADTDSDSDSDTDSDADGDFPGDCESAARFTLDGEVFNFCSRTSDMSKCTVDATGGWMTCIWFQDMENALTLSNLKLDLIAQGDSYSMFDSAMSVLNYLDDGTTFLGSIFNLHFDNFEGVGGVMSGSFTATLRDDENQETVGEITDGLFYAPIVQE